MLLAAPAGPEWVEAMPDHFREARGRVLQSPRIAWLRLGDVVVQIVSDHASFLRELDTFYGDCLAAQPSGGTALIRCHATALEDPRLLFLCFEGARVLDPLDIATGLYRPLRRPLYVQRQSGLPGLRMLAMADSPHQIMLASDGRGALIDLQVAPPELALDCIVDVAQSAQPGVTFLHAGSVGIGGSGVLLLGPSQAGKSTNAMALAWLGHAFLGDDTAAVRLGTRELLPFPKSAGLRDGPLAQLLSDRLRRCRHILVPGRNGQMRKLVRVSELFPESTSGPLPLRFAFFLDGMQDQAGVTRFRPGISDIPHLKSMIMTETNSSWGLSAGQDLMQMLKVLDLLSGLSCFRVKRGSTLDTARLIEAQCAVD